jgi:membrane-anchored glycerophosphoryl diester phosphodiesterase (GDPDase)
VIYISIAGGIGVLVLAKPNPNPVMFFLLLLGFLLLIPAFIYGILVMLRLSLAFPACVEEGLSARDAIQRSCWLTQGAKGRIFLVMLVLHAAIYAIIMALELISMLLVAIGMLVVSTLSIHLQAPGSYIGIGLGVVCLLAMMVLWMALTYAAITTALAVLYNDQRLRKDSALPVLPLYGAQPPFLPTLEPNS